MLGTGCGLVGLVSESTDTDHIRPRTTLRGVVTESIDLSRARFEVLTADGAEVEVFGQQVDGNRFDLALAQARYPSARLSVSVGGLNLLALIPVIEDVDGESEFDEARGLQPTEVEVSRRSTLEGLVVVARVTSLGRSLQSLDPVATEGTLAVVGEGASTATVARIAEVIDILVNRADPSAETSTATPVVFQWPEFQPEGEPAQRSLVEGSPVLDEGIDFGGLTPVSGEVIRVRFDGLVGQAAGATAVQECLDPEVVRMVLEVDFNEGRLDGTCSVVNRFRWVRDEPGKQMFFVGGVHETSPVQSTTIDAMLGNPGAWTPNIVPMFDDGTNGDSTAGDNVWTITFDLPRGLRIGYKYTWGTQGALWTGSEEWPGNQRLLELVDVNEDGFVYRRDHFADEAWNKDFRNGRVGTLDFSLDGDGDGILDAREFLDVDNDCRADPLTTPTGVGPATLPPNEDGSCPEQQ